MIDSCKIQCWLKVNTEIFFLPERKEMLHVWRHLFVGSWYGNIYLSKYSGTERKYQSGAMYETLNRAFQQIPKYVCPYKRKSYHQLLDNLFSLT